MPRSATRCCVARSIPTASRHAEIGCRSMGNIVPQGTDGGDGDLDGLLDALGLGAGIRRLLPDETDLLPYLLKDIPGEAGLRLRARWYGRVLGGLGEGCTIGPGITFVHPERVFLADGVRLAGNAHLAVP